ncbi:MAG: hypothetical protein LBS27_03545 [Bifidobacteriaceae bacterium]|jgi:hypothetical protein|nr:hypothetical protein [Bifidobacteriaceae bacterium]
MYNYRFDRAEGNRAYFKDDYGREKQVHLTRWNGRDSDLPQFLVSPDGNTVTVQWADGRREDLPLL